MKTLLVAMMLMAPVAPAVAQQAQTSTVAGDETRLQQRALEARSASEHAAVARQFRQRAEALTAEADRLDAEFQRQRKGASHPIFSKWPALDPGRTAARAERLRAVNVREAAYQASRSAARHHALAIESGFATTATD